MRNYIFLIIVIAFALIFYLLIERFAGTDNSKGGVLSNIVPSFSGGSDKTVRGKFEDKDVKNLYDVYEKSPYFGQVTFLNRTKTLDEPLAQKEYFVLNVGTRVNKPINITNWVVFSESERNKGYKFPQGIDLYNEDELPIEDEKDILVNGGDRIIVNSGRSPIGYSFRVNKCSSYSQQFQDFYPSIKKSCPDAVELLEELREVPFSDSACFDFVDSLSHCTRPTTRVSGATKLCQIFINQHLSEGGCIADFKNDDNFYQKEYRIFLDQRNQPIWKALDDALFLLDADGKIVDVLEF